VPPADDNSNRTLHWILGLLAVISVLLATGIFMLWRRPKELVRAMTPATARPQLPAGLAVESSGDDWKQRALAAEAMAGKQGELLREKIMPELTEFAKQSLVQGLYAQRNALIETQRKAQESLAELEARLKTLQAPLQDRIRAYEQRIAELEREVETQGDEMRELTRATLTLVRRKLEDERQSGQLHSRFN
jgi:predicted exporter